MTAMKEASSCVLSLLLLLICVTPAAAQLEGAALGDLFLSFAPDSYVPTNPVPLSTFDSVTFYLVVSLDYGDIGFPDQNAVNGIKAWEAGVDVPREIIIQSAVLNPPGPINLSPGIFEWTVGLGRVITNTDLTPWFLVTFSGVLLSDTSNLVIGFVPVSQSSFSPAEAGWLESTPVPGLDECINPSTLEPQMCLRRFATTRRIALNCSLSGGPGPLPPECAAPAEPTSWGAVKARFAN